MPTYVRIIHTETKPLRDNQMLPPVFFVLEVVLFGANVTVAFSSVLVEQVIKKRSPNPAWNILTSGGFALDVWSPFSIVISRRGTTCWEEGGHHLSMISLAREGLTHVVRC